jgi:cell division protein FtsB
MADGGSETSGTENPAQAGESGIPAPPPAPPAPERPAPDLAFVLASGIALVAALVLVRNLLPTKQDLAETLRREEDLRKEIEDLKAERLLLEMKAKALQHDDAYKERVLRGQTGMSKPGEFIVR